MKAQEMTSSYIDLSNQGYALFVEALASANKRALDYTKSVYEIASRPYASTAIEANVRDSFDRSNQLMALTVSELQANGQNSAEFATKFAAHASKVQESIVESLKGLIETGVSNANFAKDTATKQFEDVAKRMEQVQVRTATAISNN